jgi:hypothetical protein
MNHENHSGRDLKSVHLCHSTVGLAVCSRSIPDAEISRSKVHLPRPAVCSSRLRTWRALKGDLASRSASSSAPY